MSNKKSETIKITLPEDIMRGVYANAMSVSHTKEEFLLDFLNLFQPQGIVNARVIMSPSHFKRVITTLSENLKKYEDEYGEVEEQEQIERKKYDREKK